MRWTDFPKGDFLKVEPSDADRRRPRHGYAAPTRSRNSKPSDRKDKVSDRSKRVRCIKCNRFFPANKRGPLADTCPHCKREADTIRKRNSRMLDRMKGESVQEQKNFSEKGPRVLGANSDFQGEVIQNASKPALPSLGAPEVEQSEFVHKTQNGTPEEPIAQNAKKSIDELVEEHIAWLRQPWSARG